MRNLEKLLTGGDLRSIGKSNKVAGLIKTQIDFDKLAAALFHPNRIIVMRAADALEKITLSNPGFLVKHKKNILKLLNSAENKELMWHLALLVTRFHLEQKELGVVWNILSK